jgi:hypothetical protein
MPAITANHCLHRSFPALIVLVVVSLGIILPGLWSEVSAASLEISIEAYALENDTEGKSAQPFPFPPVPYLCLTDNFSTLDAVYSTNSFLHCCESVRAPPLV